MVSFDPWPGPEESMREAVTMLVMGRYAESAITKGGSG